MILRTKKILSIVVLSLMQISLLSAGCVKSPAQNLSSSTPTPLPTLSVQSKPTYTVQRGTILDEIIFEGRIVPVKQQELYFKVSGRVRKTYVKEGDVVKAGTLLADLEAADGLERQQAQRALSVNRAEIRLNMAKMDLSLFQINANPYDKSYQSQLYLRSAQVDLAQLDLDEANMGVNDSNKVLTDSQLIAPFDGKLLSLNVEDGKEVVGYKPTAVIANVDDLEISADSASDITGKITEKMVAAIKPTDVSSKAQAMNGSIRRLPYTFGGVSSDASSSDKTTRISMDINAQQAGYRLGDLVRVTVVLKQKDDALWLPPAAIRTYEGRTFVVVKSGAIQQRIDVKLGIKQEDKVEILEGLQEGMIVIAS
jgi:RND family efflux transporter MFP subunit